MGSLKIKSLLVVSEGKKWKKEEEIIINTA
jgi:hypothetical protein